MGVLPYVGIGVVILIVIMILSRTWRRNRQKEEMKRRADDALREETLDRILMGGKKEKQQSMSVPFDVKYDLDQRKKGGKKKTAASEQAPVMLQLTERNELSTRKYMLHVINRVTIGSQAAKNDVVITGSGIADQQCEIMRVEDRLYVKNLEPEGRVLLKRKKRQAILDRETVELKDGDTLVVGGYTYEIKIL